jgi:hypothetical protein
VSRQSASPPAASATSADAHLIPKRLAGRLPRRTPAQGPALLTPPSLKKGTGRPTLSRASHDAAPTRRCRPSKRTSDACASRCQHSATRKRRVLTPSRASEDHSDEPSYARSRRGATRVRHAVGFAVSASRAVPSGPRPRPLTRRRPTANSGRLMRPTLSTSTTRSGAY